MKTNFEVQQDTVYESIYAARTEHYRKYAEHPKYLYLGTHEYGTLRVYAKRLDMVDIANRSFMGMQIIPVVVDKFLQVGA
jgi:hypothetical protein